MDQIDRKILGELQSNAEQSVQEIADKVGLSATPTARRIRNLRESGIIKKQVALLDPVKLGLRITVFTFIRTSQHEEGWLEKFARGVNDIAEVVEFHRMSGDIDYLLKIMIADITDYDEVYKRLIKIVPLSDVSSSFAMENIKDTTALPLTHLL
ncbi:MAG: Lrp/AsnC family transcriptional regulator [Rhodospirillales bacterium]|nr:Lrp/AsnC family transcriptional regulator [Rhodospirillales bacterium]